LISLLIFTVYHNYKKKMERTWMSFRASVLSVKALHGSSTDYFVHLSNGESFLFSIPNKSLNTGDSVIKLKDEKYFIAKKSGGRILYWIDLDGKFINHKTEN